MLKLASSVLSWRHQKMHATFFQKVILCAIAGFFAASVLQWAKVFVEGADDALNKGYKHRAVIDLNH